MERMFYKDKRIFVEVYETFHKDGKNFALVFSANQYKNTGNGWQTIRFNKLIPEAYWNNKANSFQSKTDRNKIKERLHLVNPIWASSDGTQFTNINDAIDYETILAQKEKESEVEC